MILHKDWRRTTQDFALYEHTLEDLDPRPQDPRVLPDKIDAWGLRWSAKLVIQSSWRNDLRVSSPSPTMAITRRPRLVEAGLMVLQMWPLRPFVPGTMLIYRSRAEF